MLVYDITNDKSFDNIKNWIRNIEEVIIRAVSHKKNISSHYEVSVCFLYSLFEGCIVGFEG